MSCHHDTFATYVDAGDTSTQYVVILPNHIRRNSLRSLAPYGCRSPFRVTCRLMRLPPWFCSGMLTSTAAPSCPSPTHGPQPTDNRTAHHQPQPAGAHAFVWLSASVPQEPGGGAAGVDGACKHPIPLPASPLKGEGKKNRAATGGGFAVSGCGGGVVKDCASIPIPTPSQPPPGRGRGKKSWRLQ
jgi:hypothetical protein